MSSAHAYDQGGLTAEERADVVRRSSAANLWWIWLVAGVLWCIAALVIVQFDSASVTTVGVIVGVVLLNAGFMQLTAGALVERGRWWFVIVGTLFVVGGLMSLLSPFDTVAGLADMLGFLFLLVGLWWTLESFLWRESGRPLWWFGFVSGPVMILMAFWTSGQFFIEKVHVLLAFTGVLALLHGIGDIVKALALRYVGKHPVA